MSANALLIDPATRTIKETYWREADKDSLQKLYELLDCEGIEMIRVSKNGELWVNSEAKTEEELPRAEERGLFVIDIDNHIPLNIIGKSLYQRTARGKHRRILPLLTDSDEMMKRLHWL